MRRLSICRRLTASRIVFIFSVFFALLFQRWKFCSTLVAGVLAGIWMRTQMGFFDHRISFCSSIEENRKWFFTILSMSLSSLLPVVLPFWATQCLFLACPIPNIGCTCARVRHALINFNCQQVTESMNAICWLRNPMNRSQRIALMGFEIDSIEWRQLRWQRRRLNETTSRWWDAPSFLIIDKVATLETKKCVSSCEDCAANDDERHTERSMKWTFPECATIACAHTKSKKNDFQIIKWWRKWETQFSRWKENRWFRRHRRAP